MTEILVINPNSNKEVTAAMDRALEGFRVSKGPAIRCMTLDGTPLGIESDLDRSSVVMPLVDAVRQNPSDAVVIACYSDPGLHELREITDVPVIGIGQAALMTAGALAEKTGVVAILEQSIPRHFRLARAMGVDVSMIVERAVGLRVHELADETRTFGAMCECVEALKKDGAKSIILGCAGMARYRARLEQECGIKVIDPCQAAVAIALGLLLN